MANKQAIQAEAQRGKKMLEDHSRYLEDQYRDWKARRTLFPSLDPSSRKWVSPLDGRSPGVWSGTKENAK
jgi:hypothetical protein